MTMPNLPTGLLPSGLTVPGGLPASTVQQIASTYGFGDPSMLADPSLVKAIGDIQSTAAVEGASALEMGARLHTLFDQAKGLYNNGVPDIGQAINAARQFVGQNHEMQGALTTVAGLATAVQKAASGQETPPEIVASFTGPLVAVMAAAAPATAGIGAAIVGVVSVAAYLLDAANIFGNKPGQQICPDFKYTGGGDVNFAIGCVAVTNDTGGSIAPDSKLWRRFPNPAKGDDAWWYQNHGHSSYVDWWGARWMIGDNNSTAAPIYQAFDTWPLVYQTTFDLSETNQNQLWYPSPNDNVKPLAPSSSRTKLLMDMGMLSAKASAQQLQAFWDFTTGYFGAWKANKEYWLNGRHGVDDADVLLHYVALWNRAHLPGEGLDIYDPASQPRAGGGDPAYAGTGVFQTAPYWTTLIGTVRRRTTDNLTNDGKLHLNTGETRAAWLMQQALMRNKAAAKAGKPPVVISLPALGRRLPAVGKTVTGAAKAPSSLVARVAVGAALGVAGLLGAMGLPWVGAAVAAATVGVGYAVEKSK